MPGMSIRTAAVAATTLGVLTLAPAALATTTPPAPTASVTISAPYQNDGRCLVDVQFTADNRKPRSVWGDQVNVDGRFVVEQIAGADLNGRHRWGTSVDVGATASGIHDVTGYILGQTTARVADCGPVIPPEPQKVFIDRTVEHTTYIPIPVPPKAERCVVTKTVVAYVAGRRGHHGPVFTRITVKDATGVVRGRTGTRKAETKRIQVTAPCGTRLRLSASLKIAGAHRLVVRSVELTDDGFVQVGVSFGRYGK